MVCVEMLRVVFFVRTRRRNRRFTRCWSSGVGPSDLRRWRRRSPSPARARAADKMEDVCSPGCPLSWLGDAYCDEACFTEACGWDVHDCIAEDAGCADGCLPPWIDHLACAEACHTRPRRGGGPD